jgi:hypothetical protein
MRQILFVVDAQGFVLALTTAWQVAYLSFCLRFSRIFAVTFAVQDGVAQAFFADEKKPVLS